MGILLALLPVPIIAWLLWRSGHRWASLGCLGSAFALALLIFVVVSLLAGSIEGD